MEAYMDMNCEDCKEKRHQMEPVPYIAYEAAMARDERIIKRLWVIIVLLILLLVGSNCAWLWWSNQWETVYQEVTQEADNGTNNFIGGDIIGETDNKNS